MSPEAALHQHLTHCGVPFRLIEHAPCRTSEESADARGSAGVPEAVGAKALIVAGKPGFVMFVLPGMSRLDARKCRWLIGKHRFARPEEVGEATGGLEIGTIPPFGQPAFPRIARLVVDPLIVGSPLIGFNAACLTRSIVMSGHDYAQAARSDLVEDISIAADAGGNPGG